MAGEAAGEAAAKPSAGAHTFETDRIAIEIHQEARRLLSITASTLLPISAATAYRIVTHPANEKIFRHLDHCSHHEVKSVDGSGRVVVESEHVAIWRWFAFSGRMKTRLLIEQDFKAMHSRFSLVRGRFSPMSTFDGCWHARAQPPERWAAAHPGSGPRECCEMVLEQKLQPAVYLPPPLGGLLRQLASRQLQGVFEDLQKEAERINSGQPTLWSTYAQQAQQEAAPQQGEPAGGQT
ncbi:hypothetical protein C2E20_8103 [Micractinium conductrix]|uniref:Coenzyme Q-binding protein COQ10 START domain-containing protein n=1 Tax=Micractinium conductrix TaxID=554055 RepID=A0A2P6V2D7_9CHLO|nr:hypothetical protein C2E20_8103 [Micractinium conductrix]|eukprot:PSC68253.1 hypothetical protein C2E20_8103 [Micractinium conductrix]